MQAYRPFIIAAAATSLSPAVLAQQKSALVPKEILVTAQKREQVSWKGQLPLRHCQH